MSMGMNANGSRQASVRPRIQLHSDDLQRERDLRGMLGSVSVNNGDSVELSNIDAEEDNVERASNSTESDN